MAVYITTKAGTTAATLLSSIDNAIKKGTIKTWGYDPTTGFTHTAASGQWDTGGYLFVKKVSNLQQLNLYYKVEPGSTVDPGTYGALNGRFISMILNHFSDVVDHVTVRDRR